MTVDQAPVAGLTSASMEALIRTYFDGCNEADEAKMVACFVPEAVHYFPAGQWDGAFRGAALRDSRGHHNRNRPIRGGPDRAIAALRNRRGFP